MRSPLIALAAVTVLAAPLAAATTPASAATCTAPELVNASVTPGKVVLGTATPKALDVEVNVRLHGCAVSVDTDLFTATDYVDTLHLEKTGTRDGVTTFQTAGRINPGGFANAEAGRFRTEVYVSYGDDENVHDEGPGFQILRAARLTTNAAPEPVVAGRTLTVTGALTRANWETLKYAGYTQRDVTLQFKRSGGSWAAVKTATSGKGGRISTTVKAGRDGCYRFVFGGSSTTAGVTSGADCVDVR
jgi:hypothetical protein